MAAGPYTLAEFFERVYVPLKLGAGAESTRSKFRQAIKLMDELTGHHTLLSELTDELLATACNSKIQAGKSPATANCVRSKIQAIWTLAAKRHMVDTFPTLGRYKEYTRAPTAWTQEQLARLFASCRQEEGEVDGVPARDWWVNLHGVLWDTGVRIGAVVAVQKGKPRLTGLEWQYLDLRERTVLVIAEHQKQKADQRFQLHRDTAEALDRMRPKHRRWVFPWPWCEATLYGRYKRILERAGLPCSRRDKFHRMRRSVASWFEAAGGNATDLLGHSSRKVTMAYLDQTIVGPRGPADVLFRVG